MIWRLSYRCDPRGRELADRHYSRQTVGAPNFVAPGRCLVLTADTSDGGRALWVSRWPFPEYVDHAWGDSWECSLFRNEGAGLASELIRSAVAVTAWKWPGGAPPLGMITFVDASKIKRKRDPGRCFIRAGFEKIGETKKGKLVFQLDRSKVPSPEIPLGGNLDLWGTA